MKKNTRDKMLKVIIVLVVFMFVIGLLPMLF
ncbi:DUF4044 domain-containing protein [Clostridium kluyveri]|nr:DUF4044 domain-containing protein [Clostridium kluyveri]UZQ51084.1 DUF4044 domain-containing protein [Clostridium kluyveri]